MADNLTYFPERRKATMYVDKPDVLLNMTDLAEDSNFGIRAENSIVSQGSRGSVGTKGSTSSSKKGGQGTSPKMKALMKQAGLDRTKHQREKFALEAARKDLETKQSIERIIIQKALKAEAKFEANMNSISEARSMLDTIDHDLTLQAETYHNKVPQRPWLPFCR